MDGTFGLTHPVTKEATGAVVMGFAWANPLAMGRGHAAAASAAAAGAFVGGPRGGGAFGMGGTGAAGLAGHQDADTGEALLAGVWWTGLVALLLGCGRKPGWVALGLDTDGARDAGTGRGH